jgi:hypothetical protein
VTVTFNVAANYPDVRILEYRGISQTNPVDGSSNATGTGGTMSTSGAVGTTNANDLLVVANCVNTSTTSAGTGFTLRLLTQPDGDIVEDSLTTTTGSYSATAPLLNPGAWVMQIVAFPAAGSPAPTPTPTPTSATPKYVQGNYAVPQSAQAAVTVPYTAAQTQGDLNVVIVGWNDSSAAISSVTDSQGNQYYLALSPTVLTGALSQSIYYAPNISAPAGSADAVTVRFTTAAISPDIRILEYSGIDSVSPLDVSVGAAGTGVTSSSGVATTTNPTDLLVGANTVKTGTAGASSGFTQRLLTQPDSDIAEDRLVKVAGTYGTAEPLTSAAGWVAQMVAFRSASGSSTPTPTPTPTPSQVSLTWNQNTGSTTTGYILYYTTDSGLLTSGGTVPASGTALQSNYPGIGNTSATVTQLNSGQTYYFGVAAYNASNGMSLLSNIVNAVAP